MIAQVPGVWLSSRFFSQFVSDAFQLNGVRSSWHSTAQSERLGASKSGSMIRTRPVGLFIPLRERRAHVVDRNAVAARVVISIVGALTLSLARQQEGRPTCQAHANIAGPRPGERPSLVENSDDLLESLLERGIEIAKTDSAQPDVREHGIGQEVVGQDRTHDESGGYRG